MARPVADIFADQLLIDCPSCLGPVMLPASAQYCPRCGNPTAMRRPSVEPLIVQTPVHQIVVTDAVGEGDCARLYECKLHALPKPASGKPSKRAAAGCHVFKIAAAASKNEALRNEATTLHLLSSSAGFTAIQPFVPRVVDSLLYVDSSRETRRAHVLAYDAEIRSPRDLYSLVDVKAAYPDGVDARQMAWIFRRLLAVLSAVHERSVAHRAVTPAHVLIEPHDHKLVVIGWSHSGGIEARVPAGGDPLASAWLDRDTIHSGRAYDLSLAARTMVYLLGGDPAGMTLGDHVEPGIVRFLERCAEARSVSGSGDAARLLSDFDRLIDATWGPRKFIPFAMPRRV